MTSVDHIGLYINDMEMSLKFYQEVFGFPITERAGTGDVVRVNLDIDGEILELIQRPGSPGKPPEGNWSHLALYVPDYDVKIEKLESMGKELRQLTLDTGVRLCFFLDPDGHSVELMEKGFK